MSLSVLRNSSENHNAYDNSSSNLVLTSFQTSRKNLTFCGTEFIDVTLALPIEYCNQRDHGVCNHARIIYKGDHHLNDLVKGNKSIEL